MKAGSLIALIMALSGVASASPSAKIATAAQRMTKRQYSVKTRAADWNIQIYRGGGRFVASVPRNSHGGMKIGGVTGSISKDKLGRSRVRFQSRGYAYSGNSLED